MPKATIVVPCYNEAQRLDGPAFCEFAAEFSDVQFLMVNDGSTDGTAHVLERLETEARGSVAILSLSENSGKAEAVRQGILVALAQGPDFVGFWDADLSTPLAEVPGFLQRFDEDPGCVAVLGSRVARLGAKIDRKLTRHYLGRLFATSASLVLGMDVYDTQCGAKMFRAEPRLQEVFAKPFVSRWVFDVEVVARLVQSYGKDVASRIYEQPLAAWKDVEGSKLSWTQGVRAFADLIAIRRAYGRSI
ncbi:MAG: dolichyl-phosphate beta-glucosyltransferase [Hyphomicrobiaceae bacterium]|jgi:dolichyl-phosphate beta-glucosyltransferase